ncbi:MAG TPA: lytic transglycosylase domain-containing protein [Sphingomicrobium sp.]|jgi:soluble lytic murein transglycosylase-like protein|nr:lytic transglycosylase domain-containing protein [Sphingomicrobium sp.]
MKVRLIALAAALGSAGAAQAEVIEVGAGGTVRVLSDAPNATWASTDQADAIDQVELIEGGTEVPANAVTVLTEQGWSGAYAQALVEVAKANDISPYLLEAVVWQESRWNPSARSRAGAIGLAQLMPGTARDLGVDPRDPVQNLSGGARYLRQQLNRFDGNVEKALAAYNAGPGRVMTAGGIPSIPETQAYVRAIVARLAANSIQEGTRQ